MSRNRGIICTTGMNIMIMKFVVIYIFSFTFKIFYFLLGLISNKFTSHQNMKYLNLNDKVSMNRNLTNVEFILKNNHSKKWEWLLEVLKHCPKLQNLTIHEVLFMSSNLSLFLYMKTFSTILYFIK
jgi:hypothetical protein